MNPLLENAGLPMLFWQMPVALIAFLPIVLIESFVAGRVANAVTYGCFAALTGFWLYQALTIDSAAG